MKTLLFVPVFCFDFNYKRTRIYRVSMDSSKESILGFKGLKQLNALTILVIDEHLQEKIGDGFYGLHYIMKLLSDER